MASFPVADVQVPADIYLVRHGDRIDSADPDWLSKAGHGRREDPHLSARGHAQVSGRVHLFGGEDPAAMLVHYATDALDAPASQYCGIHNMNPPTLQAQALARRLRQCDPPVVHVVCSPFVRCFQTVAPFIQVSTMSDLNSMATAATTKA